MNAITPRTRKVLEEYSQGLYPADEAARRLWPSATIHDVIHQMRELGLPLPRQPREVEQEELARASRLFGLAP